jgi:UDP-N-acetylglucosamine:LPS N-acetylglucosamine transferase
MQQSHFVVSRAGYTTIMDLCFVNKKCLLIPTPYQPEQEYIASRLKNFKVSLIQNQNEISFENIEKQMSGVDSIYNYYREIKKW